MSVLLLLPFSAPCALAEGEKILGGEEEDLGGGEKDLGGAGRPLSEGSPYPPNLPDPPRTSLHGNRRVGVYRFPTFLGRRLPRRKVFGGLGGAWRYRVRLRARLVSGARLQVMPYTSAEIPPAGAPSGFDGTPQAFALK